MVAHICSHAFTTLVLVVVATTVIEAQEDELNGTGAPFLLDNRDLSATVSASAIVEPFGALREGTSCSGMFPPVPGTIDRASQENDSPCLESTPELAEGFSISTQQAADQQQQLAPELSGELIASESNNVFACASSNPNQGQWSLLIDLEEGARELSFRFCPANPMGDIVSVPAVTMEIEVSNATARRTFSTEFEAAACRYVTMTPRAVTGADYRIDTVRILGIEGLNNPSLCIDDLLFVTERILPVSADYVYEFGATTVFNEDNVRFFDELVDESGNVKDVATFWSFDNIIEVPCGDDEQLNGLDLANFPPPPVPSGCLDTRVDVQLPLLFSVLGQGFVGHEIGDEVRLCSNGSSSGGWSVAVSLVAPRNAVRVTLCDSLITSDELDSGRRFEWTLVNDTIGEGRVCVSEAACQDYAFFVDATDGGYKEIRIYNDDESLTCIDDLQYIAVTNYESPTIPVAQELCPTFVPPPSPAPSPAPIIPPTPMPVSSIREHAIIHFDSGASAFEETHPLISIENFSGVTALDCAPGVEISRSNQASLDCIQEFPLLIDGFSILSETATFHGREPQFQTRLCADANETLWSFSVNFDAYAFGIEELADAQAAVAGDHVPKYVAFTLCDSLITDAERESGRRFSYSIQSFGFGSGGGTEPVNFENITEGTHYASVGDDHCQRYAFETIEGWFTKVTAFNDEGTLCIDDLEFSGFGITAYEGFAVTAEFYDYALPYLTQIEMYDDINGLSCGNENEVSAFTGADLDCFTDPDLNSYLLVLASDGSSFRGAALDSETRLCASPDGLNFQFHPRVATNAVSLVVCRSSEGASADDHIVYGMVGILPVGWDDDIDWDVEEFSLAEVEDRINVSGFQVAMKFDLTESRCEEFAFASDPSYVMQSFSLPPFGASESSATPSVCVDNFKFGQVPLIPGDGGGVGASPAPTALPATAESNGVIALASTVVVTVAFTMATMIFGAKIMGKRKEAKAHPYSPPPKKKKREVVVPPVPHEKEDTVVSEIKVIELVPVFPPQPGEEPQPEPGPKPPEPGEPGPEPGPEPRPEPPRKKRQYTKRKQMREAELARLEMDQINGVITADGRKRLEELIVGGAALNKCDHCGKEFRAVCNLITHLKEQHGGKAKSFKCDVCDKAFKRKYNLTVHKRTHLKKTNNPFKCKLCGQTFNQKSNLKRHMLVRHEKPARCSDCSERFANKSEFDAHVAADHPGQANVTMQILAVNSRCVCRKRFDLQADLDRHQSKCEMFQAKQAKGGNQATPQAQAQAQAPVSSPTNHDRLKATASDAQRSHPPPPPPPASAPAADAAVVRAGPSRAQPFPQQQREQEQQQQEPQPAPRLDPIVVVTDRRPSASDAGAGARDRASQPLRIQNPEYSASASQGVGIGIGAGIGGGAGVQFATSLDTAPEQRLADPQAISTPSTFFSGGSSSSMQQPVSSTNPASSSLFSEELMPNPDIAFGQSQPLFTSNTAGALLDNGIPAQPLISPEHSGMPSHPFFSSSSDIGDTSGRTFFSSDSMGSLLVDNPTGSSYASNPMLTSSLNANTGLDLGRYNGSPGTGIASMPSTASSQALSPVTTPILDFSTMPSQALSAISGSVGDFDVLSAMSQPALGQVSGSSLGLVEPNSVYPSMPMEENLVNLGAGGSPIQAAGALRPHPWDFATNENYSSLNTGPHLAGMAPSNSMQLSGGASAAGMSQSSPFANRVIDIPPQSTMPSQATVHPGVSLHEATFGVPHPAATAPMGVSPYGGVLSSPPLATDVIQQPNAAAASPNSRMPLASIERRSLTRSDATRTPMTISANSSLLSDSRGSGALFLCGNSSDLSFQSAGGSMASSQFGMCPPVGSDMAVSNDNNVVLARGESQVPMDPSTNANFIHSASSSHQPIGMSTNSMMHNLHGNSQMPLAAQAMPMSSSGLPNGMSNGMSHSVSSPPGELTPRRASRLSFINRVPTSFPPTSPQAQEPPKRNSVTFAPIDVSPVPLASPSPKPSRNGVTFAPHDSPFQKPFAAPSGRHTPTNGAGAGGANGVLKRDPMRDTPTSKSIVRQNSMSVVSNASSTGAPHFPSIGKLPSTDRMESVLSNDDMSSLPRRRSDSNISMSRTSLSQRSISLDGDKYNPSTDPRPVVLGSRGDSSKGLMLSDPTLQQDLEFGAYGDN